MHALRRIKGCFGRGPPPPNVLNAFKRVGRVLNTTEYLGYRTKLHNEVNDIEAVMAKRERLWQLIVHFVLAFMIGTINFVYSFFEDDISAFHRQMRHRLLKLLHRRLLLAFLLALLALHLPASHLSANSPSATASSSFGNWA